MPNVATILPESAFGKLIFLIFIILLLTYFYSQISGLLSMRCGGHAPALMIEQFGSDYDSSTQYYKNLNKRLDELDKNIQKSTKNIDKIDSAFTSFQSDICYILNQVDDGIKGNYSSNVPEEEYKLPNEEQEKRKKERQRKGVIYVSNLKKAFVEARGGGPMLECFANMTEDETANLKDTRMNLMDRISEVTNSLKDLTSTLHKLKNSLSETQIAMYYMTIQYNEKYLKQMIEEDTIKHIF